MLSRVVRRGGFANPHKTSCHFGALLQGIFSNEPLLAAITEHGIHEGDEAKDCVLCLLQRTEGDSVNASVVSLGAWHPLLESLGLYPTAARLIRGFAPFPLGWHWATEGCSLFVCHGHSPGFFSMCLPSSTR